MFCKLFSTIKYKLIATCPPSTRALPMNYDVGFLRLILLYDIVSVSADDHHNAWLTSVTTHSDKYLFFLMMETSRIHSI